MSNFLKKLIDVDPEGIPCKDCGHYATSHHLKIQDPNPAIVEYTYKMKRLECRECNCVKFI